MSKITRTFRTTSWCAKKQFKKLTLFTTLSPHFHRINLSGVTDKNVIVRGGNGGLFMFLYIVFIYTVLKGFYFFCLITHFFYKQLDFSFQPQSCLGLITDFWKSTCTPPPIICLYYFSEAVLYFYDSGLLFIAVFWKIAKKNRSKFQPQPLATELLIKNV